MGSGDTSRALRPQRRSWPKPRAQPGLDAEMFEAERPAFGCEAKATRVVEFGSGFLGRWGWRCSVLWLFWWFGWFEGTYGTFNGAERETSFER